MIANQITVNADAIAEGMLEMVMDMPDSYQGALAVGMLPAPLMAMLERQLNDKAERLDLIPEQRRDWVRSVQRRVSLSMIRLASERGLCLA